MLFIFSTPGLIRHLWQLKRVVFLHWCQICALLFAESDAQELLDLWGITGLSPVNVIKFSSLVMISKYCFGNNIVIKACVHWQSF
jgi:hypothetical protein